MGMAGRQMNGLSLHYYTLPTGNWRAKGSATRFAEDQWFATLIHQGGTFLPVELQSPDYVFREQKIPMVSASATRGANAGGVHLSLANASPHQAVTLTVKLAGIAPTAVAGRVLTAAAINAHNTFAAPDAVRPAPFDGAKLAGGTLEVHLPAKSVVVLALR